MERIAIVGAGAVGGTLACYLSLGGKRVVLLARGESLEVAKAGFTFIGPDGDKKVVKVETLENPSGDANVVIYATKAYDLRRAAHRVRDSEWRGAFQMTLQNGLGNEETLAKVFGREQTLSGVIYISAEREKPGVFRHLSGGMMYIGSLWITDEKMRVLGEVKDEFGETPLRVKVTEDVKYWIFRKLLWNAAFNPISAILNMEINQMVKNSEVMKLAELVMEEVVWLAEAEGVNLGDGVIERTMSATVKMGGGETSMLADLRRGRRMEIEAILEKPLQLGERLGVNMAALRTLYEILLFHSWKNLLKLHRDMRTTRHGRITR